MERESSEIAREKQRNTPVPGVVLARGTDGHKREAGRFISLPSRQQIHLSWQHRWALNNPVSSPSCRSARNVGVLIWSENKTRTFKHFLKDRCLFLRINEWRQSCAHRGKRPSYPAAASVSPACGGQGRRVPILNSQPVPNTLSAALRSAI